MSRLEFFARPLVAFDCANKDHRRFYAEFLKYKTWGRCPVQFIVPDAVGYDLVRLIQLELIDYYADQEFGREKPRKPVRSQKVGMTHGGLSLVIP